MIRRLGAATVAIAAVVAFAPDVIAGDESSDETTESHGAAPEPRGMLAIRFREHFDVSQIRWGEAGANQAYFGATNTVNLWWEVPGRYAFGLAFMPVLTGGYGAIGEGSLLVDGRVTLWNFGLEGKWHLRRWGGFGPYLRGGLYGSRLAVSDFYGGDRWGGSYYAAFGSEVPVWDRRIGIAVDLGFRHTVLERDTQILSFSPSVAVALYFVTEWLSGGRPEAPAARAGPTVAR